VTGTLTQAPTTELTPDALLDAYRTMRTIRDFEERVHEEFATGDIPGFVHLYAGEEASATGVCSHLDLRDAIASTHRGHGHCIAKGVDVMGMMAEIFGKLTGSCRGKGGSMHIADLSKGMLGANGIVGGGPPLICGRALASKFKGDGGVAVAFFGDGASNQGTTLESLNLASIWNLPAIFVAENNGYAEATSSTWSVATDDIADRAAAFGMPGVIVDGFDFFAVHEAAGPGGQQAGGGAGNGGLPHLGEGVVGAGRQGQQRDVPAGRRGRADGTVATERDDHAGAAAAHRRDERPGVVGGAGERVQLDELEVRQPPRAGPALRQCPHDAACDTHAVGGDEGPLDPGGPRGGEQPHHHVGLLGVREHRGLRDEAPDVAARHRVGDDPDRRARYHRELPARDRAHRRSPSRGGACGEGCSGVAVPSQRPASARTAGADDAATSELVARSGSTTSTSGASR